MGIAQMPQLLEVARELAARLFETDGEISSAESQAIQVALLEATRAAFGDVSEVEINKTIQSFRIHLRFVPIAATLVVIDEDRIVRVLEELDLRGLQLIQMFIDTQSSVGREFFEENPVVTCSSDIAAMEDAAQHSLAFVFWNVVPEQPVELDLLMVTEAWAALVRLVPVFR